MNQGYQLIDSGNHRRLEQFGSIITDRPAPQAVWRPALPKADWQKATLRFERLSDKNGKWHGNAPEHWSCTYQNLNFKISPTSFGHLGLFPEHATLWQACANLTQPSDKHLNLFGYTGGMSLGLAQKQATVVHVDASKPVVRWASDNARQSNLADKPISWLVEDAFKFIHRELKRKNTYEGIILDPPSFGRGPKNELFKIESDLPDLLSNCVSLLSNKARFLALSCHTPGFTPTTLNHLLTQATQSLGGSVTSSELIIPSTSGISLPCGYYALWSK